VADDLCLRAHRLVRLRIFIGLLVVFGDIAAVAACLGGEEMRFGAAFVDEVFRQLQVFI
jgi:hypothetical protein